MGKILELYHYFPISLHDVHRDNFTRISALQMARLLIYSNTVDLSRSTIVHNILILGQLGTEMSNSVIIPNI